MARGQIDTPVVMIFAVVAGILVLLIVGWFVLGQQSSVDNERLLTSLKGIEVAIGTTGSSRTVEQNISTIGQLRYVCDEETGPALWYGEDATRTITSGLVFSSPNMSGTVTLRSAPLGGAYRVANVVYMTSLQDSISGPDTPHLPIPVKPASTYARTLSGKSLAKITITQGDGSEPDTGWISFNGQDELIYFSPALLAGALVSGNKETYDCALGETLKRYRFANKIQWDRMISIRERYRANGDVCADQYDERPFFDIEKALVKNGETKQASDFELTDAQDIARAERLLIQLNDNLVRASCATMS